MGNWPPEQWPGLGSIRRREVRVPWPPPPLPEEQMSTSDRTHDPLGLGPGLRDLDAALRQRDEALAALRDLLRTAPRVLDPQHVEYLPPKGIEGYAHALKVAREVVTQAEQGTL